MIRRFESAGCRQLPRLPARENHRPTKSKKRITRRPYNGPAHPRRAESRYHRSAGTRGARERAPCVGCSRMLYGSSNAPASPTTTLDDGSDLRCQTKPRTTHAVPSQLHALDDTAEGHAQRPDDGDRSAPSHFPSVLKPPPSIAAARERHRRHPPAPRRVSFLCAIARQHETPRTDQERKKRNHAPSV